MKKRPTQPAKDDGGKPDFSLLIPEVLEELAQIMTDSASKRYAPHGYRLDNGLEHSRYVAAAYRHLSAIHRGEYRDPKSGYLHATHLMANGMILSYYHMHPKRFNKDDLFRLIPIGKNDANDKKRRGKRNNRRTVGVNR